MKQVCFFFFLLSSLQTFSQKVALKNNLAYDALLTPNLSVEFSLGKKWTLDAQVGMNFFFYENDATANRYKTRKWSHWLVQPEVRYWTCETFNGLFWGIHTHGGQMNVAGINIPFIIQNHSREMKGHRYEGSVITVVVPWGRTAFSNSGGDTMELSICICPSIKPGQIYLPVISTLTSPSYSPMPAMQPSSMAMSPISEIGRAHV